MKVVAFRHTISDGMGSLVGPLDRAGDTHHYIDTFHEDISGFDACAPDLLVVMGGAPGVYQSGDYPFLTREIKIIEQRLARDLPTLGICLGAQLMAAALGAHVYRGAQGAEQGWFPITVNEQGMKTPLRHLDGAQTMMVHWHGDTFDLPKGATLLASSAQYEHQAFSYGRNALGLQCHPEVTPRILQSWFVNAASEVGGGEIDLKALRAETESYASDLIVQAGKFMQEWTAQRRPEKEGEQYA